MQKKHVKLAKTEYQDKLALAKQIERYYEKKLEEYNLNDFSRIKKYLSSFLNQPSLYLDRDIIYAHLNFEPFTTNIAKGEEFIIVSGLNSSAPLHLGHKILFHILLFLQKLGANIYIPISNDESYLDSKVSSLSESRKFAYEEIIPSIVAFGFNPAKTKILVDSDYSNIYNFAILISKHLTTDYVEATFGEKSLDNAGKAFYRSAVQLAHILLPQLDEFGGVKHTLVPVGIDQHPYILLARDVAKKLKLVPPSDLIIKFQNSLKHPFEKMSKSQPNTAIYLTDSPTEIDRKIQKAFTGAVSVLEVHRELGAIPEACSVFSLLYYHHPDNKFVESIYRQYKSGKLLSSELKKITTKFIIEMVVKHQKVKEKIKKQQIDQFLLKKPLRSFL